MKLLASDFDGTLLMHEKEKTYIKEKDKKAIMQFQKEGHLFGICTGRSLDGILSCSENIHYDFYILNSGAIILDKDQNVIQKKYIDLSLAKEVFKFVDQDACCTFVVDGHMYVINADYPFSKRVQRINSLDELPSNQLEGFSLHYKDNIEKTTEVIEKIHQRFSHDIAAYQNIDNIDMVAYGCSKGNGIKVIQNYYHLSNQDVYVIGDSWNDIPMFEVCDNAMTFHRSALDVQQRARYLVNDIEECIEKIKQVV